jgi:hypothetical protein
MLKKLAQRGLARNDGVIAPGRQSLEHQLIDIGPAVDCSRVTTLRGRPYPVEFRNQGAIDAWTRALGHTEVWRRWQDQSTLCWQIRKEILRQFEHTRPERPLSGAMAEMLAEDLQRLAVEISVNLKYHLQKGTVIEATPALETLLTNSDVDLSLPMSMVALPYPAQYLRFGDTAMRYLKVPVSQAEDHLFDGVFCFLTPPAELCADGESRWTLELIFASKRPCIAARRDRQGKHHSWRMVDQGSWRCQRTGGRGFPSADARRGQLRCEGVLVYGIETGARRGAP